MVCVKGYGKAGCPRPRTPSILLTYLTTQPTYPPSSTYTQTYNPEVLREGVALEQPAAVPLGDQERLVVPVHVDGGVLLYV